jgi:hypothetical protein
VEYCGLGMLIDKPSPAGILYRIKLKAAVGNRLINVCYRTAHGSTLCE